MNLQANRIMKACAALVCAATFIVAAEAVYSIHLKSSAKSFTTQFEKLRILVATKEETLGSLRDFQGVQKSAQLCDSSGCASGYAYEFKNPSVVGMLGRSGKLIAELYFRDDVLVAKHLVMSSATGCCFASIKEGSGAPQGPLKSVDSMVIQSNGTPYGVNVWISPEAINTERVIGYQLNFNCLLPLSRCGSAHDLLVDHWKD